MNKYTNLNEMARDLVGDGKTRKLFVTIGYGWEYIYDADKDEQDEPKQVKGAIPEGNTIAVFDTREEAEALFSAIEIKREKPTRYSITDVMIEDKTGVLRERRLTFSKDRNRYYIDDIS